MIERCGNMHSSQSRDQQSHPKMNGKKRFGQGLVLGNQIRHGEKAEEGNFRAIGRGGDPAYERLRDQQHIKRHMDRMGYNPLHDGERRFMRRRAVNQPVSQANQHQEEHQHAERAVNRIEHVLQRALRDPIHRQTRGNKDQNAGRDYPMQEFGYARILAGLRYIVTYRAHSDLSPPYPKRQWNHLSRRKCRGLICCLEYVGRVECYITI